MSLSLSIIFGVVPELMSAWKPEMAPHAMVMKQNGNSGPGMMGPPPPVAISRTEDRSQTVLIVEDNDDAREALHLLLESIGHRVLTAGDGRHGLELALHHRPDVVLIDLGLPELDGYELARAIRRSTTGTTVKLIAITGYGQAEDLRRSKDAGFDEHLVKPVSESVLSRLLTAP